MHLVTMNQNQVMSSREIAELTGKRHDNVLVDIRKMLSDLGSPENSGNLPDAYVRPQPVLLLDKEQSLCLVAGYSAPLRMAIIKRWQDLESQAAKPVELSRMDILRMAMESEESRIKAESALAIAAPKAEVFDRVIDRDTLLNATQVAQQAGMSAVKLNRILDDVGGRLQSVREARAHVLPVMGIGGSRRNEDWRAGLSAGSFHAKGRAARS